MRVACKQKYGFSFSNFSETYRRFVKAIVGIGSAQGNDSYFGLTTEFVLLNNPYEDNRKDIVELKLIYQEKPELLSKEDYDEIHSTVVKRVLSTNNEPWNTIPRVYAEIDTLREKFERSKETEKLKMLEDINVYVEELEKNYSRA